jgi:uncharacterized protein YjbJ (UPF0337 family)
MDKDRIAGSAKDFAGKVESAAGGIADDATSQAAGGARQATGAAQNLYGQAKDAARDASDAAVSYAKDAYENSGKTFRDGSHVGELPDRLHADLGRPRFRDRAHTRHQLDGQRVLRK